jgi:acyl-coenzyme A synthetase/AMP-(fatty) acid ligase/acyl carrier protein
MQATPGLWSLLAENGWPSQPQLKAVTAGEALSATLSNKLLDLSGEVWNMYGPTEATIYTTYGRMTKNNRITIGKPVSNTRIYLLDKYGELVPAGIPGRLYIAGDALSRGYLNREELNKEKFISFTTIPEKRVYDSGDICSWTENGELLYHGRSDSQVKVRGYRIELGEIEQCLLTYPAINEVTVQCTSIHSDTYLVAYYSASEALTADLLRTFLRSLLPIYMIPTYFRQLEVLPRNVNGKVDRKLLPSVEITAAATMMAPRNEGEAQLLLIWKELLHTGEIGIEDNFFELGGHSLVAIVLLSRIYKSFAVKMELKDVFYYPTIAALHEKIELIKWASSNRYSTTGIDTVNEIII